VSALYAVDRTGSGACKSWLPVLFTHRIIPFWNVCRKTWWYCTNSPLCIRVCAVLLFIPDIPEMILQGSTLQKRRRGRNYAWWYAIRVIHFYITCTSMLCDDGGQTAANAWYTVVYLERIEELPALVNSSCAITTRFTLLCFVREHLDTIKCTLSHGFWASIDKQSYKGNSHMPIMHACMHTYIHTRGHVISVSTCNTYWLNQLATFTVYRIMLYYSAASLLVSVDIHADCKKYIISTYS
jgi:hypothetical protein